jgi:hypothetical protein
MRARSSCHRRVLAVLPYNDIAFGPKSDKQPCARYYNKTKDMCSIILDNLGYICKVLLSLNIESCYIIFLYMFIRSNRSIASRKSEVLEETTRVLSTLTLYNSKDFYKG